MATRFFSKLASKYILVVGIFYCATIAAQSSDFDYYGEINVSYDWSDLKDDDWQNYVSRLGLRGSHPISEDLTLIYQLEQKVNLIHGGTEMNNLFKTRNSFIGISGNFGKLMFGTYDTPFKKSQGKIDLFNDQAGDMAVLVPGEIRAKDTLLYHSPDMNGWQIQGMYIPSDDHFDESQSVSLGYGEGDWQFGFGLDSDVRKNDRTVSKTRVYDSIRGVARFAPGPWAFGLLLQSSEQQNIEDADSEFAYVASISYKIGKVTVMAQHGESDILGDDLNSDSLGVHYNVHKKTKVYVYYWTMDRGSDDEVLSLGFEHKF